MTGPEAPAPTPRTVLPYLRERGVLPAGTGKATVERLSGGVSGDVLLVAAGDRRVVVKTALARLRVPGPWFAKVERSGTEAAALLALHALTPANVPALLDADADRHTLTIAAAPPDLVPWKAVLLRSDLAVATESARAYRLGEVLRTWHDATGGDPGILSRFRDDEALCQLRIDPFHRVVAARHPGVRTAVERCVQDLLGERTCLVHGDFSPKNVLVGDGEPVVLDFEVAHCGSPVFDVAFMHTHLLLKAVHGSHLAAGFAEVGAAFSTGYGPTPATPAFGRLGWHVASLLLARVDGTSPVDYLTPEQQRRVRSLALSGLSDERTRLPDLWRAVTGARR